MNNFYKKFVMVLLTIITMLVLSGCGKTGESEAEKLVKEACNIPDSFKKIDYQVDEKIGLAYLDFKAKNMLGVELPGRAYFKLTKDHIQGIDTGNIDRRVLDEFYKDAPTQFVECVDSYMVLKKNDFRENFEVKYFIDRYRELKYDNNNFFSWQYVAKDSIKVNDILKKYKDAYSSAPEIVKRKFPEPIKYFKITLNGSYMGGWSANGTRTDDFPEQ